MNLTLAPATPASRMHVVWDWNGTVKDELDDHVSALNATLPALGGTPVDRETYRAKHTVPIPNFYARLLGRTITEQEWIASYNAPLAAHLDALGLTGRAHRVLLVGDAVDDTDAAHANGALAVLHTGGLHHPAKLAAAGHPLTETLTEAVALGLRLAARSAHPVAA